MPFTLALVADLLGTDPGITPDQLVGPQASMPYLVERVIGRIEDVRLRWVVRAGVVPRRLSFDFFRHVLAPLLTEVAAETFPDDEDDLRGLWDRLIDYAGSRSWIALSPAQPDTVVFHPDVVGPLRGMLGPGLLFQELNRRAADLTAELLGPDFVEDGRPRRGGMSPQTLAEIHLERARAQHSR